VQKYGRTTQNHIEIERSTQLQRLHLNKHLCQQPHLLQNSGPHENVHFDGNNSEDNDNNNNSSNNHEGMVVESKILT
jgi:hypothetical protein